MANLNAGPTLTAYECLTLADCCPCLTSMYYVFVFFFLAALSPDLQCAKTDYQDRLGS